MSPLWVDDFMFLFRRWDIWIPWRKFGFKKNRFFLLNQSIPTARHGMTGGGMLPEELREAWRDAFFNEGWRLGCSLPQKNGWRFCTHFCELNIQSRSFWMWEVFSGFRCSFSSSKWLGLGFGIYHQCWQLICRDELRVTDHDRSHPKWAMKKTSGCLGYIGDYATQLCRDCFTNHYKDPY